MLKLSMKKLGTPENEDALNVEGSGGVSADGETALAPVLAFPGRWATGALVREGTIVWGWERCVRTSGAGVVVASVVGVVVVGVVFGLGVVLVVVVGGADCEGAGSGGAGSDGGAGTVVVPVTDVEASEGSTLVVASASAPLASASARSPIRSESSVAVSGRRIVMGQLPSR